MERIISKSKFKPNALKFFREIEKTGRPLIISDHGKPVIKIIPYVDHTPETLKSMRNTVVEYKDPLEPVGLDNWDALK